MTDVPKSETWEGALDSFVYRLIGLAAVVLCLVLGAFLLGLWL